MLTTPQISTKIAFAVVATEAEAPPDLEALLSYADFGSEIFGQRPWRLVVANQAIEVHADLDHRLKKVDCDGRESIIATGSAIFLLRLALRCHNLEPSVDYTPDVREPSLLARISVKGVAEPTREEIALFSVLTGQPRGVAKLPSLDIVAPDIQWLVASTCAEGTKLRYVENEFLRSMTSSMLQSGDKLHFNTTEECSSFKSWLGLTPIDGESTSEFVSWSVFATEVAEFKPATELPSHTTAVICTGHDDVSNWLSSGQALSRTYLAAVAAGMKVTVFNQPLQVPGMRARFAREAGFCNFPQVVLRVEYNINSNRQLELPDEKFLRSMVGVNEPCSCGCQNEEQTKRM